MRGEKKHKSVKKRKPIETEMTAMLEDIIDFFIRSGTGEDKY